MTKLSLILIVCFCVSANAGSLTEDVRVGGIQVTIPAPTGYVSLKSVSPIEFQRLSRTFAESVNTVSLFVEDKYVAELMKHGSADLTRYYAVHSIDLGSQDLNWEIFRDLRAKIKKRLARNNGNKLLNKLEEIKLIDYSAFGVFYDNDYSIGYLDIIKNTLGSGLSPSTEVFLLSTNMVNVGRLLIFNIHSLYNSPSDIEWIKESSESWSKKIYKENNIFANENWREEFGKLFEGTDE